MAPIHQKKIRDVNKLPMRLDIIITRKVGDFGIVTRTGRVGRVRHPPNSSHFFLITSSRSRLPCAMIIFSYLSHVSTLYFYPYCHWFLRPVTRIAVTVRRKDPVEGQGKTRPSYLDIHSACQVPESFDVRGLLGPRPRVLTFLEPIIRIHGPVASCKPPPLSTPSNVPLLQTRGCGVERDTHPRSRAEITK
ncbi:hypothetical protein BDV41DRAFT_507194 [Aspergillus transmontanensis]|uniref:Uncharacterized protein n=1 Tax=Aspergillus transmontanensis TaxID=1034304 RepID=A0A5N6VJH9_9EURO|nr:hypothetical protein BDV41DRAFT_507194 [Aspergillus transmontanensis]